MNEQHMLMQLRNTARAAKDQLEQIQHSMSLLHAFRTQFQVLFNSNLDIDLAEASLHFFQCGACNSKDITVVGTGSIEMFKEDNNEIGYRMADVGDWQVSPLQAMYCNQCECAYEPEDMRRIPELIVRGETASRLENAISKLYNLYNEYSDTKLQVTKLLQSLE